MDIENLVKAAIQALVNNDTDSIKEILRQGSHASYIFPSVTDGRGQPSARDLFLQLNTEILESFLYSIVRCQNFDDSLGNILLHQAARISDYELISLLLDKGADVTSIDKTRQTALHIACKEGSAEIVKFLTESSPAYILNLPDQHGRTPLDLACAFHCPEVIQFVLSQGSSVGEKDDMRFPLFLAVAHDNEDYAIQIVSLLLDAGANINQVDEYLETPLINALQIGPREPQFTENSTTSTNDPYVELCLLLIDRGCDVNAADSEGSTALHYAVEEEIEIVVRKLLISGSDIDRCDSNGDTPLHIACEIGNQRLADLLIISGANLRALDSETILKQWSDREILNDKNTQVLNYVIREPEKCLSLKNLCYIKIRKSIRNVEKDATQLGLPPLLVRKLQLKD